MNMRFYKTLAHIALPIMVQEFINSFVNILDTFMIGSLGVHEITAVGLANQLFFLFILAVFGMTSGASILMGQFWGADEVPEIKKTLGICILGSILAAGVFSCFAAFAPGAIMGLYSKDQRVIELGSDYLQIIWISYILSAITMSYATALKSIRETRIPMVTTVIALFSNAFFNYIFIFKLNWGVAGAAWGTVIARSIELFAIIAIIYWQRLPAAAKPNELFSADWVFVKRFVFISLPVLLNEFTWALGTTMYNIAYKYCGTEAQGALQISNAVNNLFMVVGLGIGFACGIMTSNALGAGEINEAIASSRRFVKLSVLIGIVMGCMLAVTAPIIVSVFNVSDSVKTDAIRIMLALAVIIFIKMLNFTTIVGILRSGGDAWFCFLLDIASVWCIGVPLAFLGAAVLKLPVYYVVALVSLEEISKLPVGLSRVLKNGWARKIV